MNNSRFMKFIIYGVLGLAAIGLLIKLFTDTTNFLSGLFMTLIFGLAIFGLLYYFVLGGKNRSSDVKKYKQAVKQSKSKYAPYQQTATTRKPKQPNPLKKKTSKRPSHLRVIDGNKSKNKKRVSN